MKTLMKVILPCLALVILISGKPVGTDEKIPAVFNATVTPDGKVIKNFDTCLPVGSQTFCLHGLTGTQARLIVNYGFTITGSNPVAITSGTACWTINAIHIVEYGLDVFNNGSWTSVIGGECAIVCDQPEECE